MYAMYMYMYSTTHLRLVLVFNQLHVLASKLKDFNFAYLFTLFCQSFSHWNTGPRQLASTKDGRHGILLSSLC